MSLATRCPACGTVFRVVQDQLRVSEGWVRCGRCAEVFNAVDRLVDLDAEHATGPGAGSQRDRVVDELARVSGQTTDTPWFESLVPAPAPASSVDVGTADEAPIDASESDRQPAAAPATYALRRSDEPAAGPIAAPEWRAEAGETPSFVRQADQAASWRRSPRRAALAAGVLLAAVALAAQVVLEYRDAVAARWTGTRPALEQLCAWAGCSVEPPRLIDALVVESSGLVRVDSTAMYRLSVVLRNRAAVDLAAPAIDLSLTDGQGRVVSRRVLSLSELGQATQRLAAGSELPMKAVLTVAGPAVTGYTIDIFYP